MTNLTKAQYQARYKVALACKLQILEQLIPDLDARNAYIHHVRLEKIRAFLFSLLEDTSEDLHDVGQNTLRNLPTVGIPLEATNHDGAEGGARPTALTRFSESFFDKLLQIGSEGDIPLKDDEALQVFKDTNTMLNELRLTKLKSSPELHGLYDVVLKECSIANAIMQSPHDDITRARAPQQWKSQQRTT